ncbi:hypothetical protein C9374_010495 [Naegleria lovaniensis]|uniref:Uncharacterized protein n=1 Tax=Naegleria lovaniensis TaxID=51637 RepID=A0AA88KGB4_NAELO|nr:uncharacterized protein C9374_010495 [Naegleria lovaniensis]KAG2374751.1 hypothetical protein C9374_010495 [Naegleria lovaniensis]
MSKQHQDNRKANICTACVYGASILFSISFAIWGLFIYSHILYPRVPFDTIRCYGSTIVKLLLVVTILEFIGILFGTLAMCSGFLEVCYSALAASRSYKFVGQVSPAMDDEGYAVLSENWIQETSPNLFENAPFDMDGTQSIHMKSSVDRRNGGQALNEPAVTNQELKSSEEMQNQSSQVVQSNGEIVVTHQSLPSRKQQHIKHHYEYHYEETRSSCCSNFFRIGNCFTLSFLRSLCQLTKSATGVAITALLVVMAFYVFESRCNTDYDRMYTLVRPFLIAQFVYCVIATLATVIITCGPFLFNILVLIVSL